MEWTLLLLAVTLVSLLVLKAALSFSKPVTSGDKEADSAESTDTASDSYRLKPLLFSPAEREFLSILDQAAGDDYRVFGKVRVADLIEVKPMAKRSAWASAFGRIKAKHFDYVVCRRDDLSVVCAVELDDSSHRSPKRQERDRFLDETCRAVGLILLRFPVQAVFSADEVRGRFRDICSVEPARGEAVRPAIRSRKKAVVPLDQRPPHA
ncbi:DUF2726 domain-containing protein [Marinobacterium arenosum]|uniref:DUF2726 domain-containing protein n=1 Tax=Marinobacterium arenosum TaxID=2862496 RepID=UPI001C95CA29|nr:DUF2726 domain-containing protein [Marinobacterium arenosum]MBY4678006.1 DUF2726 domain-containing protein [Marinobacterium arenosum]